MPPLALRAFSRGLDRIIADPGIGTLRIVGPFRGYTAYVQEDFRPPLFIYVGIAYEVDYVNRRITIITVGAFLDQPDEIGRPAEAAAARAPELEKESEA